jgi:23S rRNA (adenine2503-C2)-methyltransferase
MEQTRPNIRAVEVAEIERFIAKMEEKPFRVKQIVEWLWQKHAHSFDEMTNLSLDLRKKLVEHFSLPALSIDTTQMSSDGTFKTRFRTFDDHMIEGVLIPTTLRKTACVSSQIGCSLSCKFCATGYMERSRNLNFDEIYDQVVMIKQQV